jgi:general stress protein 26
MSQAAIEKDSREVGRLIAGAAETMTKTPFCWLVTADTAGRAALRPMGRLKPDPGDSPWTIRFVTDGRSRKASDMRRNQRVTVLFQQDDDAFVTLSGTAIMREGESEIRARWRRAYEPYFPGDEDRANAAFVEVEADRMELWIRGLTPEPFGTRTTTLERDATGAWRLIPLNRARRSRSPAAPSLRLRRGARSCYRGGLLTALVRAGVRMFPHGRFCQRSMARRGRLSKRSNGPLRAARRAVPQLGDGRRLCGSQRRRRI